MLAEETSRRQGRGESIEKRKSKLSHIYLRVNQKPRTVSLRLISDKRLGEKSRENLHGKTKNGAPISGAIDGPSIDNRETRRVPLSRVV